MEGSFISVHNISVDGEGVIDDVKGKAYCEEDPASKCYVKFFWLQPYGKYNVLLTDYNTEAVVYSCSNWLFFHSEYAWVLSRKQNYKISDEAIAKLAEVGVTKEEMMIHDLEACPSDF